MKRCVAYCLAKRFDMVNLTRFLNEKEQTSTFRDVILLQRPESINIMLFSFGVVVFWGMDKSGEDQFCAGISKFFEEALGQAISDEFEYSVENQSSRIHDDHIYLSTDDQLEKVAISFGIAQSIKLEQFENLIHKTIEETQQIPRNIASTGKSLLGRNTLAKKRGQLYLVESDINLNFDLLDTPEFFWEYPEVEDYYIAMRRYLDVIPRIEVLNKRLSVIRGLLDMLADELNHKHSSTLEWIIIWLIAIEIILFLIYDLSG